MELDITKSYLFNIQNRGIKELQNIKLNLTRRNLD